MILLPLSAQAEELLHGTVLLKNGEEAVFTLHGDSREQLTEGELGLGDWRYRITNQSRLGLIGASRALPEIGSNGAEYVVFSSSFSQQTGVGNPWVSATEYFHCEQPYNTFLALYRVNDSEALNQLGPVPYPLLAEGKGAPAQALVYCFNTLPSGPD